MISVLIVLGLISSLSIPVLIYTTTSQPKDKILLLRTISLGMVIWSAVMGYVWLFYLALITSIPFLVIGFLLLITSYLYKAKSKDRRKQNKYLDVLVWFLLIIAIGVNYLGYSTFI
ncbi:hypothetical protein [Nonlabens tegetincola]|nr:hypothetical protein [Nonlabens tegetincola]